MEEKKSCDHHMRNQEALHDVNVKGSIVLTVTRRKVNWTGHILHGSYLQKRVIEGKVEGRQDEEENMSSHRMT
jgi:hypothetical protein